MRFGIRGDLLRTAALRPDRVVERAEKLGNSSTVDSRFTAQVVDSSTIVLQIQYLRTLAIPMIPSSFVKSFVRRAAFVLEGIGLALRKRGRRRG
jgi:CRISPR/Cas system CMR subunit Cmr6 (Cas7 group RAMP superfamily)